MPIDQAAEETREEHVSLVLEGRVVKVEGGPAAEQVEKIAVDPREL